MHFDESRLTAFIKSELTIDEAREIEAHLEGCNFCYDRYMSLLKFFHEKKVKPPPSFVDDLLKKLEERRILSPTLRIRAAVQENSIRFFDALNKLIEPISIPIPLGSLSSTVTSSGLQVDFDDVSLVLHVKQNGKDEFSVSVSTNNPEDLSVTCYEQGNEIETIQLKEENAFQTLFASSSSEYLLSVSRGEKVVDFAINTDQGTILIESKGILVHPIAKAFPKQSTLISTFKDTIIKAIVQGENTARLLYKQGIPGPYYLYIITLDELYFGSTPDLLREFISLGLTTHFPDHRFERIAPDHIFVISINDFEQLIDESTVSALSQITIELVHRQRKTSYSTFLHHLAQVSGRNNGRTKFHQMMTDPLFKDVEEDARTAFRDHSPSNQTGT